ncbi:MAG TPA: LuxR C-terminal-related transcriptional regulator [Bacillota bacterium]|nr:LuxR C-terminal-related transcriptional regulator [Bacillota bacterium]
MTKEIFTTLIESRLYLQLFLICISSVTFTFILFKFGLMTLKVRAGFRDIFPVAFTLALFNFFMHQYLPIAFFAAAEITLTAALLVMVGKVKILEGCWTSLLMYASSNLGSIIIMCIFFFIDRDIMNLLINSTTGYIFGPLIEAMIAAGGIVLLTKKPSISLIPPIISKRVDYYDVLGLFTYGTMALLLFFSSIQLYDSLKKGSRYTFLNMIIYFSSAVIIFCGHISIVHALKKRFEGKLFQLEKEKAELEYEKAVLKQEKEQLKQEKAQLEQKEIILEQEKAALEAEKTELLVKLQKFTDSPTIVENPQLHQIQDMVTELIYDLQHVNNTISSLTFQQKTQDPSDKDRLVPGDLTSQERMILKCLGNGLSYKEVGAKLDVAEGTAKNWAGALMKKLGLKNQLQLAAYAAEHGLLDKADKNGKK